jgi:hypothetical protein
MIEIRCGVPSGSKLFCCSDQLADRCNGFSLHWVVSERMPSMKMYQI